MAPLQPEIRQKPDGQRGPGKLQPSPRGTLIWWLVMIGIMVWNIVTFWPKASLEVTIPYTTFLDQVRSENVANVHVTGDQITGAFVKPFRWPEATRSIPFAQSEGTLESKPQVSASPGTTKAQTRSAPESKPAAEVSPRASKPQSQSAAETEAPVKASPGATKGVVRRGN